eukprot:m.77439 g.77439  ORF g.77439 m.77439 type:complete len:882 (-) comp12622_c0_seq1:197-2842(-)
MTSKGCMCLVAVLCLAIFVHADGHKTWTFGELLGYGTDNDDDNGSGASSSNNNVSDDEHVGKEKYSESMQQQEDHETVGNEPPLSTEGTDESLDTMATHQTNQDQIDNNVAVNEDDHGTDKEVGEEESHGEGDNGIDEASSAQKDSVDEDGVIDSPQEEDESGSDDMQPSDQVESESEEEQIANEEGREQDDTEEELESIDEVKSEEKEKEKESVTDVNNAQAQDTDPQPPPVHSENENVKPESDTPSDILQDIASFSTLNTDEEERENAPEQDLRHGDRNVNEKENSKEEEMEMKEERIVRPKVGAGGKKGKNSAVKKKKSNNTSANTQKSNNAKKKTTKKSKIKEEKAEDDSKSQTIYNTIYKLGYSCFDYVTLFAVRSGDVIVAKLHEYVEARAHDAGTSEGLIDRLTSVLLADLDYIIQDHPFAVGGLISIIMIYVVLRVLLFVCRRCRKSSSSLSKLKKEPCNWLNQWIQANGLDLAWGEGQQSLLIGLNEEIRSRTKWNKITPNLMNAVVDNISQKEVHYATVSGMSCTKPVEGERAALNFDFVFKTTQRNQAVTCDFKTEKQTFKVSVDQLTGPIMLGFYDDVIDVKFIKVDRLNLKVVSKQNHKANTKVATSHIKSLIRGVLTQGFEWPMNRKSKRLSGSRSFGGSSRSLNKARPTMSKPPEFVGSSTPVTPSAPSFPSSFDRRNNDSFEGNSTMSPKRNVQPLSLASLKQRNSAATPMRNYDGPPNIAINNYTPKRVKMGDESSEETDFFPDERLPLRDDLYNGRRTVDDEVSVISYAGSEASGMSQRVSGSMKSSMARGSMGKRSSKSTVRDINGHAFVNVKVLKPRDCAVCSKSLKKMMSSVAYRCKDCGILVHKKKCPLMAPRCVKKEE